MLDVQPVRLASGAMLALARLGAGTPVVLLHGYPDTLQVWSLVAPILAERHEVLAIDWPGLGGSDAWAGGATPQAQSDRLAAILSELGVGPAHVVGLDMGGQPALAFAARHAAACRSVTVSNSLVMAHEATSWEIRVLRRFGWNRAILRWLPRAVFRRAERTFLSRGSRLPAEVRNAFWQSFRRREVREFIVRMCAGYQGTLERLPRVYASIARPALILWGEADAHFPLAHARALRELIPDSRLDVIPCGQHWMALEQPAAVAEALLRFLRECDAGGADAQ